MSSNHFLVFCLSHQLLIMVKNSRERNNKSAILNSTNHVTSCAAFIYSSPCELSAETAMSRFLIPQLWRVCVKAWEKIIIEDRLTCCTGRTSHSGGHRSSDTQHMWCTARRPPQGPEPPKPEGGQGGVSKEKHTCKLLKSSHLEFTTHSNRTRQWSPVLGSFFVPFIPGIKNLRSSASGYVVWITILPFFLFNPWYF